MHNFIYSLNNFFPKAFVREMINMSGHSTSVNLTNGPSNKWFNGFMRRHPDVSMRAPDTIDRGRYQMANRTVMESHFDLLKKTLENLGIKMCFIYIKNKELSTKDTYFIQQLFNIVYSYHMQVPQKKILNNNNVFSLKEL